MAGGGGRRALVVGKDRAQELAACGRGSQTLMCLQVTGSLVPSGSAETASIAGAKVSSATTIGLEVTDDAAGARARGHDVSLEL